MNKVEFVTFKTDQFANDVPVEESDVHLWEAKIGNPQLSDSPDRFRWTVHILANNVSDATEVAEMLASTADSGDMVESVMLIGAYGVYAHPNVQFHKPRRADAVDGV